MDDVPVCNDCPGTENEASMVGSQLGNPKIIITDSNSPVKLEHLNGNGASCCSSSASSMSSDAGSVPQSPDVDSYQLLPSTDLLYHGLPKDSEYVIPITGYEIIEEKARYTIYNLVVQHRSSGEKWQLYRRYTDFLRLNKKLNAKFSTCRFSLPPKRWFRNNFELTFLEERVKGLQAYINKIITHKEVFASSLVKEFFCFGDSPVLGGNHGANQMSEASLNEILKLRQNLRTKESEMQLLREELSLVRTQLSTLIKSVRLDYALSSVNGVNSNVCVSSIRSFNCSLLDVLEVSKQSVAFSDASTSTSNTPSLEQSHARSSTQLNETLESVTCAKA